MTIENQRPAQQLTQNRRNKKGVGYNWMLGTRNKKMKLQITNERIGLALAFGIDGKGEKHMVFGGDLCYGETIEVEPYNEESRMFINPKINYDSIDIFSEYFDKDGLIDFRKLKEVKHKSKPFQRIYELGGYWVFPQRKIQFHIEYLYENNLIQNSRIKITKSWSSILGRAPVYAVNYIDLLKKVIERRESISSWFICEREKDFDKGVYADLFVLGNFNESDLQIQLWQIIGEGDEILFAHGLIDRETFKFKHFDLATHYVHPMMIPRLIYDKQRIDLINKEKWLRVDGVIEGESVFELIKMFFPIDYLVDEFKENPVPDKD